MAGSADFQFLDFWLIKAGKTNLNTWYRNYLIRWRCVWANCSWGIQPRHQAISYIRSSFESQPRCHTTHSSPPGKAEDARNRHCPPQNINVDHALLHARGIFGPKIKLTLPSGVDTRDSCKRCQHNPVNAVVVFICPHRAPDLCCQRCGVFAVGAGDVVST